MHLQRLGWFLLVQLFIMSEGNRPYIKNNSFSKKPGLAQIASYVVFLLETVLFYSVVLPKLRTSTQIFFGICYSASLLMLVISAIVTSLADPADLMMVCYRNSTLMEYFFGDAGLNSYKDKLLFCDYCKSYVKNKSRHCKTCDRCVQDFDHHCMWINNCVGGNNYRSFFVMIIGAFLNLLFYVAALLSLTFEAQPHKFLSQFIVAWCSGTINAIFVVLLINLIILHLYLIHKGISTYEFIVIQRQEEEKRKREQAQAELANEGSSGTEAIMKNNEHIPHSNPQTMVGIQKQNDYSPQNNVVKVRSGRQNDVQGSQSDEQQSKVGNKENARGIFQQNQMTEKSQKYQKSQKGSDPPIPLDGRPEKIQISHQSQSEESMVLSQLFTRNKSLKLILGKSQIYPPHAIEKKGGRIRDLKSKSMHTQKI